MKDERQIIVAMRCSQCVTRIRIDWPWPLAQKAIALFLSHKCEATP